MIEFFPRRSKFSGIRINVFRRIRELNSKSKKIEHTRKQVGSFKLTDNFDYPEELTKELDAEEIVQLKNFMAEAKFAAQFNEEVDALAKISLLLPQKLYDAYIALDKEAQTVDMHFIPNQIMLDSLLKTAKIVEQKITKMRNKPCHVLEKAGLSIEANLSREDYEKAIDVESRTLFKALLELKQPLSKTCDELEAIAKEYGKQKERISAMQLKEWAGNAPGRTLKKVNRWCFAMAIDALLKHNKNPLQIASPEKVTRYWISHYQTQWPVEKAKKEFIKLFNPTALVKSKLLQIIEASYKAI